MKLYKLAKYRTKGWTWIANLSQTIAIRRSNWQVPSSHVVINFGGHERHEYLLEMSDQEARDLLTRLDEFFKTGKNQLW